MNQCCRSLALRAGPYNFRESLKQADRCIQRKLSQQPSGAASQLHFVVGQLGRLELARLQDTIIAVDPLFWHIVKGIIASVNFARNAASVSSTTS